MCSSDRRYNAVFIRLIKMLMVRKMKVAIVTITDGANYGNRLQNYAMQEILQECGVECYTLRRDSLCCYGLKYRLLTSGKKTVKKVLRIQDDYTLLKKRKELFAKFNKKYIRFGKEILQNNIVPHGIESKYDFFVCGSDQIWNVRFPFIRKDINNYLATFADGQKRIAYAASFGTSDIPNEYISLFSRELLEFKAIGVREDVGVKIIADCCGRTDQKVVLDPTMMLSEEQWMTIAKKPQYIDDTPFIVTYFLSGSNEKLEECIKTVSEKYRASIVQLSVEFMKDSLIDNPRFFSTTPEEFIWLIRNARCILTDSYHATLFSILFQRPFSVFNRKAAERQNEMQSRITTLLRTFGIDSEVGDIDWPQPNLITCSSDVVKEVLIEKKKESKTFLVKALGLTE